MTEETPAPASYPITYTVEPQHPERNRLTVAFRIILAIPQWLLVGGPGGSGANFGSVWGSRDFHWAFVGAIGNGVLGAAAGIMAIISWFAIVFRGKQPRGL